MSVQEGRASCSSDEADVLAALHPTQRRMWSGHLSCWVMPHVPRGTRLRWWCDALVLCIVLYVHTMDGEVVPSFVSPSMFLASCRGLLVIRLFRDGTPTRCHSPRTRQQALGLTPSRRCNVCCELVFHWLPRSWTPSPSPGRQPLPMPRWGRVASSVFWVSFCYTVEKINMLHVERLWTVVSRTHLLPVSLANSVYPESYVFILKSKEGSMTVFQIWIHGGNVRFA